MNTKDGREPRADPRTHHARAVLCMCHVYKALALVLVYLERRKIFMLWCFWGKKSHTCTPGENTWVDTGGACPQAPGVTGRADRSSEFERAATSEGEGKGVRVGE